MSAHEYGIWPPYEAFYIQSMLFNTQSAVASIEHVHDALNLFSEDMSGDSLASPNSEIILNNFQNIVVQGAALSKYFWPIRNGHESRATLLRESLNIDDDNPLKSRELRDMIEHFDEKLDKFLYKKIMVGMILPQYVGPLPQEDGVQVYVFRAYYMDVGLFEMLGKRYLMQPISDEICRLHEKLSFCAKNGGRLQS